MIGSRHIDHAQRGGGGVSRRYHSLDELHLIPKPLVEETFRQLTTAMAGPGGHGGGIDEDETTRGGGLAQLNDDGDNDDDDE